MLVTVQGKVTFLERDWRRFRAADRLQTSRRAANGLAGSAYGILGKTHVKMTQIGDDRFVISHLSWSSSSVEECHAWIIDQAQWNRMKHAT